MKVQILAVVVLACVSGSLAQMPGFGSCPEVTVMQNFEPAKYLGKWYENQRYFTTFEFGGKCNNAEYTLNDDGSIHVFNKEISSYTGKSDNITGKAVIPNMQEPAKLSVTFPGTSPAPYWVIDTDYDNYSVVYTCYKYGLMNFKFSWILTRQQQPELTTINNAYSAIDKQGINRHMYLKVNQAGCPAGF